jgi:hypothetical protein
VGQQRISGIYGLEHWLIYLAGNGKIRRAARRGDEEEIAGWEAWAELRRSGGGDGDVGVENGEVGRLGEWESGRVGEWESGRVVGRVGEWESGRVGEWESGRVGEWEIGWSDRRDFHAGQEGQAGFQEQVALGDESHSGGLNPAAEGPGAVVQRQSVLAGELRLKDMGIQGQVVSDDRLLVTRGDFQVMGID